MYTTHCLYAVNVNSNFFFLETTSTSVKCTGSPVLAVRHTISLSPYNGLPSVQNTLGRHCCLWCTIPSSQLKVPLQRRGRFPARTLETLRSDLAAFASVGYDPKQAKECNVIGEYIFDIPLENVLFIECVRKTGIG